MTLKSDVRAIARIAGDDSPRPAIPKYLHECVGSYALRSRWMRDDYTRLRNASLLVRKSRHADTTNPIALLVVVQEAERLAAQGEPLFDIFEAFCELIK